MYEGLYRQWGLALDAYYNWLLLAPIAHQISFNQGVMAFNLQGIQESPKPG